MPFLKTAPKSQPLCKQWEIKAQRSGPRNTVYSVCGDEYTGHWLDNKKHGTGTKTWKKSGAVYEGEWKYGKRDGYGVLSLLNPDTNTYARQYCGEWKDGKKHGYGTQFYRNSDIYEGGWREGQRSGYGRMIYSNGDVYDGEWMNNLTNGHGVIRLANGNWYDGTWKDGRKNGVGKFCYASEGHLYEGFWVNGIAKCGSLSEYHKENTPAPKKHPIPKVQLLDAELVLTEAHIRAQALVSPDGWEQSQINLSQNYE